MNWYYFFANVFSLNTVELLLLLFYLGYPLPKRNHYWLRAVLAVIIGYGFGLLLHYFMLLAMQNSIRGSAGVFLVAALFFCTFVYGILAEWFCQKISFREAFFIACVGYTARHMLYLLTNILDTFYIFPTFSGMVNGVKRDLIHYGFLLAFYVVFSPFLYMLHKKIQKDPEIVLSTNQNLVIAGFAVLFDIIFNLFRSSSNMSAINTVMMIMMNFFACFLILLLMFNFLSNSKLEREVAIENQLRKEEAKQSKITQETIDAINIKTHDLRHQLRDLADGNSTISPEEIKSLEEETRIYDTRLRTGNHSVDVILQEKSLLAKNRQIIFHCMVDGTALTFLKNEDTYSLFGNLLNNALDAAYEVQPAEKRYILLKIRKIAGGCSIYEENSYQGERKFKDGLLETTSKNKDLHGYGLRSIGNVVKQYDGTMQIDAKNGVFTFQAFFPLPKEEGKKDTSSVH